MNDSSALELLEHAFVGMTGKEQFDALAGTRQLWWLFCQNAIRLQADWPEARHRITQLAEVYGPAEDGGRSFLEAADALTGIAQALGGTCDPGQEANLAGAVRYWNETGLLTRAPAAVMRLRPEVLAGQPGLRRRLELVTAVLDELPGGSGRAMAALVALLLADPQAQVRRRVVVPVLFDRQRRGGGLSGRMEICELSSGPAGLYPDPRMMSFTRATDPEFAAGLARAWDYAEALSRRFSREQGRCIIWRLIYDSYQDPVFSISGGSLGAAFAVALKESLAHPPSRRPSWTWLRTKFRGLRPGCAVTGVIASDRALEAVGGMAAKLEAAATRRWRLVAPAANRTAEIHVPAGVHVYWAADLAAADHFARRWRPVRTGMAAVAVAGLLAVGATALYEDQAAHLASQAATAQRDINLSRQLAADSEARDGVNATVSQQESIAAWTLDPSPSDQAYNAMLADAASPQIATLSSGNISWVAAGRDGAMLATVGASGSVQEWNAHTRQPIGGPFAGGNGGAFSVTFSPDGTILAIVGSHGVSYGDGSVRLWSVRTRQPIGGPFASSNGTAGSVAFSPDGSTLATVSALDQGTVQLWDVRTRQLIGELHLTGAWPVKAVAFSPDGTMLYTISEGSVQLWDARTRQPIGGPFATNGRGAAAAAFSPDGTILVTVGTSGSVQEWNARSRQPIGAPFANHAGAFSATFSPDGTMLAIVTGQGVGFGGSVRLWNPRTRQPAGTSFATNDGGANAAEFLSSGTLVTDQADGTVQMWNTTQAAGLPLPFAGGNGAQQAVFSPDGTMLATTGAGTAQLWNARTLMPIGRPFTLGDGDAQAVAFSPDGMMLAIGKSHAPDASVLLWNVHNQQPIGGPFDASYNGVSAVAFSAHGTILATIGNSVQLWNVHTQQAIDAPFAAGTVAAVLSPDGSMLATVGINGVVQLWKTQTSRPIGSPLPDHDGGASTAAFSPDGTTLAIGSADGTVQLWNVRTHQPIGAPFGELGPLAFSPDGTILAIGDTLWDPATGQQIGTPLLPGLPHIDSVTFSPDGRTIAIVSDDPDQPAYQVQLWNVGYLVDPLARLCSLIGGSLTRTEWAEFVGPGPAYQNICP